MATTVERASLAARLEAWPAQMRQSLDALAGAQVGLLRAQSEVREARRALEMWEERQAEEETQEDSEEEDAAEERELPEERAWERTRDDVGTAERALKRTKQQTEAAIRRAIAEANEKGVTEKAITNRVVTHPDVVRAEEVYERAVEREEAARLTAGEARRAHNMRHPPFGRTTRHAVGAGSRDLLSDNERVAYQRRIVEGRAALVVARESVIRAQADVAYARSLGEALRQLVTLSALDR